MLTGPVLVPPKIHSSDKLRGNGASNRDLSRRRPFDRGQRHGVMGGNDGRVERRCGRWENAVANVAAEAEESTGNIC